ncbi:MAG: VanZ family protein [Rhodocyclaceae bacterium]|nr:VanZ family protein [Rhodocyclaceae bacterium]
MAAVSRSTTDLPRHLAFAYALLVVYACLHPFAGWHESGLHPLDFISAPWPRYYRVNDMVLNVLGFVPLGFLMVPALPRGLRLASCVIVTVLACFALSLSLETLQNFLPTRVASNLDLGFNTIGGLAGGLLGAAWGPRLFAHDGGIHRWRSRCIVPGPLGDAGLILMALWLFSQLVPESPVFSTGDLRRLLDLPTPLPFSAQEFLRLEAAITAGHLLAAVLLARAMARDGALGWILLLVLLALGANTLASASFLVAAEPFAWATPGWRAGLIAAVPLIFVGLSLPRTLAQGLAAMALLAATVLVNLAPQNPYLLSYPQLVGESHFLNFHGATRLVSSLWPFLALAYLILLGALNPGLRR